MWRQRPLTVHAFHNKCVVVILYRFLSLKYLLLLCKFWICSSLFKKLELQKKKKNIDAQIHPINKVPYQILY